MLADQTYVQNSYSSYGVGPLHDGYHSVTDYSFKHSVFALVAPIHSLYQYYDRQAI